jgi:molecular chaperone GrpE
MPDPREDTTAEATRQGNGESPAPDNGPDDVRARLSVAEQERDQFKALLQRTRADFENYEKRVRRDREQERLYAGADLAGAVLPILDNLQRALDAAQKAGEAGPLVQGVSMVEAQFRDVLRRFGVTPIEAEGRPFDPNLHQAVASQPSAEHPPGTVLATLEPGYTLHDRVLRPARVLVSAAPPEESNKEGLPGA